MLPLSCLLPFLIYSVRDSSLWDGVAHTRGRPSVFNKSCPETSLHTHTQNCISNLTLNNIHSEESLPTQTLKEVPAMKASGKKEISGQREPMQRPKFRRHTFEHFQKQIEGLCGQCVAEGCDSQL